MYRTVLDLVVHGDMTPCKDEQSSTVQEDSHDGYDPAAGRTATMAGWQRAD